MKSISLRAQKVVESLVAGMAVHSYRRFESPGMMPLSVERIAENQYAISHVGEQNGDLMRDPEVVFLVGPSLKSDRAFYPIEFRNDYMGVHQELAVMSGREVVGVRVRQQADCASYCATWMPNLVSYQLVREVA